LNRFFTDSSRFELENFFRSQSGRSSSPHEEDDTAKDQDWPNETEHTRDDSTEKDLALIVPKFSEWSENGERLGAFSEK
jgi:hypothetical protein